MVYMGVSHVYHHGMRRGWRGKSSTFVRRVRSIYHNHIAAYAFMAYTFIAYTFIALYYTCSVSLNWGISGRATVASYTTGSKI